MNEAAWSSNVPMPYTAACVRKLREWLVPFVIDSSIRLHRALSANGVSIEKITWHIRTAIEKLPRRAGRQGELIDHIKVDLHLRS